MIINKPMRPSVHCLYGRSAQPAAIGYFNHCAVLGIEPKYLS